MNKIIDYPGDLKSDPSGFRQRARKHQSDYRQNILKVSSADPYGSRLIESDGLAGLNFYEKLGVREAVEKRFKKYKEQFHSNLLRSEHIPFNFFVPIEKLKHESQTVELLNKLIENLNAVAIDKVVIEYPSRKENPLGDSTCFDTYIETVDSNDKKTGIGVEVKYTELSYPYGATEKKNMFDESEASSYHSISEYAGISKDNIAILRQKNLKQLWRNYLLGVAMVKVGLIKKFVSVHLYPEGNTYQAKQAKVFEDLISNDERFVFIPLTFEQFISCGSEVFSGSSEKLSWFQYLNARYIVK